MAKTKVFVEPDHDKLVAFYREVAQMTVNHDVLYAGDSFEHAVVFPSKLDKALQKVDPKWYENA